MDIIGQILDLLGNPRAAMGLLPHPASWPTAFQDALRAYMVPNIAWYIGLLLILLALASSIVSILTNQRGMRSLLGTLILVSLWGILAPQPGNSCIPDSGYPCVVNKTVQIVSPGGNAEVEIWQNTIDENGNFRSLTNPGQVVPIPSTVTKTLVKNLKTPAYAKYVYNDIPQMHSLIESVWWLAQETGTRGVAFSMIRYQDGIEKTRKKLVEIFATTLLVNVVGSGVNSLAAYIPLVLAGKGGKGGAVIGFGGGLFGGALGGAVSLATAGVVEVAKAIAAAIALAPLAVSFTYSLAIAGSGFLFYLVFFLFPLFLGLAALFGVSIIRLPLQIMIFSIMIPLIMSPLVGATMHMLYGYNDMVERVGEKTFPKELMSELPRKDKPADPFMANLVHTMVVEQLRNTYECLRPFFPNGELVERLPDKLNVPGIATPECYTTNDGQTLNFQGNEFKFLDRSRFGQPAARPREVSIESFLSYPIQGTGKTINRGNIKIFYKDLGSLLGDGLANNLDLLTPRKLEQMGRIISRYGIEFSVPPGNFVDNFAHAVYATIGEELRRERRRITEEDFKSSLRFLGVVFKPEAKDALIERKAEKKFIHLREGGSADVCGLDMDGNPDTNDVNSSCLISLPWEISFIIDRYILANELGVPESIYGSGNLAHTALSLVVSMVSMIAISLVVFAAGWSLLGTVLSTGIDGLAKLTEPPGLTPLTNLVYAGRR